MAKKQATKPKKQKAEDKAISTTATPVPALPAYMQEFLAQSQADTSALVSSSVSVPRLSYRGKRWRFIVDGEEELIKTLSVAVVIIGVEPDAGRFIKTLYLNAYNPGDSSPPDCSSSNGITPDVWVSSPQAMRCNQCPKNIFGSAVSRSGGKAKACHDSKRLWVVKPDDMDIIYCLNVPIMSLKNLAEYGKYIARNNFPLALVITELSMDDESEFPKLCFNHNGFVEEDYVQEVADLNQRRPWKVSQVQELPNSENRVALPAPNSRPTLPMNGVPKRKEGEANVNEIIGDWAQ